MRTVEKVGNSQMAVIVAALVAVIAIVAGVIVLLAFHNEDSANGFIAIFIGFVGTIIPTIVAMAQNHATIKKVDNLTNNAGQNAATDGATDSGNNENGVSE